MKIVSTRSNLLECVKAVQDVVIATNDENPFRNVRVDSPNRESVLVTGSNGNIQIQYRVFCETDGGESMTIVGSKLAAFVGSMEEGPVEITDGSATRAKISGASAEFSLAKGVASDFPLLNGPDGDGVVTYFVRARALREMLRNVNYAASFDKTRAVLGGVLVRMVKDDVSTNGTLRSVATDGRRLSIAECEGVETTGSVDAILSNETVKILMKLLANVASGDECEASVACDGRSIRVTADAWSVTSKLVDGVYPAFEKVIPSEDNIPNRARVDADLLRASITRASLACWKDGRSIKITFDSDRLTCEAQNQLSRARSVMNADYKGPRTVVKLDPKLVLDVLGCVDSDDVTISFKDGFNPLVMTCDVPFKAVVMPVFNHDEE